MDLAYKSCTLLLVQCPSLANGTIKCLDGSTTGVFGDTCTFSCDNGFQLQAQGSHLKECLATGRWREENVMCVAG